MATQSQYQIANIPLRGGLDFVTPKTQVAPGTLSECLNFEVADRLGYRRINGYVPYDGKWDRSLVDTNAVVIQIASAIVPPAGHALYSRNPEKYPTTRPFGYSTYPAPALAATHIYAVVTNFSEFNTVAGGGNVFSKAADTDAAIDGTYDVEAVLSLEEALSLANIKESLEVRQGATAEFVNLPPANFIGNIFGKDSIPSGYVGAFAPIIGLEYYKEKLYAVEDLTVLFYDTSTREFKPGDVITDSAFNMFTVRVVGDTTGDPSAGTGAGILYTDSKLTAFTAAGGDLYRATPGGAVILAAKFAASTSTVASSAALYRTKGIDEGVSNTSWEPIDMGYTVSFKNGKLVNDLPPQVIGRSITPTAQQLTAETSQLAFATVTGSAWSASSGTTAAAIAAADAVYLTSTSNLTSSATATQTLVLSTPSTLSSIPQDAVILGVKFGMRHRVMGTDNPGYSANMRVKMYSDTTAGQVKQSPNMTINAAYGDTALGGSGDLWGAGFQRADLDTLKFGISTYYLKTGGTSSLSEWRIDQAYVIIYYQVTSSYYYFASSGTDEVRAVLVSYNVTAGDWADGDAEGTMVLAQVEPSDFPGDAPSRWGVLAGDEMHFVPQQHGIGTDHFADIDSDMVWNGLDSTQSLLENKSRYQFKVANFYGNADWEAIYGVSGAGRAFVYDGFYFRRIYTGLPESLDKPRHVTVWQGALALGYPSGNVTLSVIGEPESFDGAMGAVSIDVSDPVTGFLNLESTTLAILCKNSVRGLSGTDQNSYQLTWLRPYEGAIEYTAATAGRPVYCSYQGISTFEQTAAYGDFLGVRLSSPVYPWLLPRLQGSLSPIGYTPQIAVDSNKRNTSLRPVAAAKGIVTATVHRSANQYKLWFADGYVLTMTYEGQEQSPVFTIQKLNSPDDIDNDTAGFVPRAECSSIDEQGIEHVFMSHCNHYKGDFSTLYPHVYELNKGYKFSPTFDVFRRIPAYMATNYQFLGPSGETIVPCKIRIHGNSYGYAPLKLFISPDYQLAIPATDASVNAAQLVDFTLPDQLPLGPYSDLYPVTGLRNYSAEGTNFAISFLSRDLPEDDDHKVSPPFSLQSLIISYKSGKGDT